MSLATSRKTEDGVKEELDVKKISAWAVTEAVKNAFSLSHKDFAVLIVGPPGIGKTTCVVEEAFEEAKKLGKEPVLVNELLSEPQEVLMKKLRDIYKNPDKYYVISMISFGSVTPETLTPVPHIITITDDDGRAIAAVEKPALRLNLALLTIKNIHGVLIIDDALNAFDNVRRSFLAAVFNERIVGGEYKLSPNVRVIATGNLVSESDLASPIPDNMPGRAIVRYAKEASLEEWYRWMEKVSEGKWYKEIYAFLKRYPNYFNNRSLADPELKRMPVPRAWSRLAILLHALRDEVEKCLASEEKRDYLLRLASDVVGVAGAAQLVAFLSKPVVDVDDVLKDPSLLNKVAEDLDLAFRFGVHLAQKIEVSIKEKKDIFPYLKIMVDLMEKTSEDIGVYIYEMLSDDSKRELKNAVKREIASKDPVRKAVSKKIREMLVNLAVTDVLLGA